MLRVFSFLNSYSFTLFLTETARAFFFHSLPSPHHNPPQPPPPHRCKTLCLHQSVLRSRLSFCSRLTTLELPKAITCLYATTDTPKQFDISSVGMTTVCVSLSQVKVFHPTNATVSYHFGKSDMSYCEKSYFLLYTLGFHEGIHVQRGANKLQ